MSIPAGFLNTLIIFHDKSEARLYKAHVNNLIQRESVDVDLFLPDDSISVTVRLDRFTNGLTPEWFVAIDGVDYLIKSINKRKAHRLIDITAEVNNKPVNVTLQDTTVTIDGTQFRLPSFVLTAQVLTSRGEQVLTSKSERILS